MNWLAAIEVAFLLSLLRILRMYRRWRLYDQWISCRFLAEHFPDSSEAWIERALTEVTAHRPKPDHQPPQVTSSREYLSRWRKTATGSLSCDSMTLS